MNHLKVKPKKGTFDARIGDYIVEEQALCKRLKLKRTLCINFPRKRKIPFWSRLALKVLRSQGGIVDMRFTDLKQY